MRASILHTYPLSTCTDAYHPFIHACPLHTAAYSPCSIRRSRHAWTAQLATDWAWVLPYVWPDCRFCHWSGMSFARRLDGFCHAGFGMSFARLDCRFCHWFGMILHAWTAFAIADWHDLHAWPLLLPLIRHDWVLHAWTAFAADSAWVLHAWTAFAADSAWVLHAWTAFVTDSAAWVLADYMITDWLTIKLSYPAAVRQRHWVRIPDHLCRVRILGGGGGGGGMILGRGRGKAYRQYAYHCVNFRLFQIYKRETRVISRDWPNALLHYQSVELPKISRDPYTLPLLPPPPPVLFATPAKTVMVDRC